jgi:hypothetical protein
VTRRTLVDGSRIIVVSENGCVFARSVGSLVVEGAKFGAGLRAVDIGSARRSSVRIVFEEVSEEVGRIFEISSGRRSHFGRKSVRDRVAIETLRNTA